jgi:ketosteroid isomerase-like protein
MKYLLISCLTLMNLTIHAQSNDQEIQKISFLINKQQTAWNNADLEGFMSSYWHSDSLTFIGKSGPKYGWQTTLDNYKKSYPTPDAMGKLTFTILKMEKLGNVNAFVVGKWALARKEGELSGYFTLLWKKIKGEWVIVVDHSS